MNMKGKNDDDDDPRRRSEEEVEEGDGSDSDGDPITVSIDNTKISKVYDFSYQRTVCCTYRDPHTRQKCMFKFQHTCVKYYKYKINVADVRPMFCYVCGLEFYHTQHIFADENELVNEFGKQSHVGFFRCDSISPKTSKPCSFTLEHQCSLSKSIVVANPEEEEHLRKIRRFSCQCGFAWNHIFCYPKQKVGKKKLVIFHSLRSMEE